MSEVLDIYMLHLIQRSLERETWTFEDSIAFCDYGSHHYCLQQKPGGFPPQGLPIKDG